MGCFWKPDVLFSKLNGVINTEVGYMGGEEKKDSYSYEEVSSSQTGHAEVVKIEYDSNKLSYEKLLETFWKNHNPTTLNRQGPDVGEQYRSVIFYYNEEQKKKAENSKKEIQKHTDKKIVTRIQKAGKFYRAEEYHQKFLEKHKGAIC
jgi:peptide-methionine (S)-S-oxide reductase